MRQASKRPCAAAGRWDIRERGAGLANEPGNILTPSAFASRVHDAAASAAWLSTCSTKSGFAR
jgi:hypothetical protein